MEILPWGTVVSTAARPRDVEKRGGRTGLPPAAKWRDGSEAQRRYKTPSSRNAAVTDRARLILTVQVVPDTVSHPLQPVTPESRFGDACSVTRVSLA